eukprot:TRINITY_DN63130_c0_g1_i3.p2 TRINITY_DN63130_c0_g1~~TRINITY_DN63130_c0_g1_i3.p2  ORF type:complete len:115 (-),score=54.89 TRINITY_DN63130_c0_g1_i3:200-544(-)
MVKADIGSVLVTEGSRCVGIVTERDYLKSSINETSANTPVGQIMCPPEKMISVEPNTKLQTCLELMNANQIRHVPVLSDGKIHGVLSIKDIVRQLVEDQQDEVQRLADFIAGTY